MSAPATEVGKAGALTEIDAAAAALAATKRYRRCHARVARSDAYATRLQRFA